MSQENVDLLRRAYEAFNGRDLDAMLAPAHDDVVVESRRKYIWWRTFQREAEALEAAELSE
jgi:ketosteroid isomerase-like protein